jgi:poly-gamma-glutamate synthesis protein (capsule biosynthesis protein)
VKGVQQGPAKFYFESGEIEQEGVFENKAGLSTWNEEGIISAIKKARLNPEIDLIILNMHWGVEYKTKSNAKQQELAHKLINAGADLIVGHHPHVVQEVEKYSRTCERTNHTNEESCGEGRIAYSLGNFVFDQNFSVDTRNGLVLEVVLNGKEIEKVIAHSVNFTKSFQPFIAKP